MKKYIPIFLLFTFLIPAFSDDDNLIKRKIAIFPFLNQKNIEEYDYLKDIIRDAIRAKLQQKDLFLFSNFNDIDRITQNKINENLLKNEEEIIKLSLKLGADVVITGKYVIIKDKIMIVANAIDSLQKQSVISSTVNGNTGIELFSLVEKVSDDMSEKMSKEFQKLEKTVLEELMKEQEKRLKVEQEKEIAKREAEDLKAKIESGEIEDNETEQEKSETTNKHLKISKRLFGGGSAFIGTGLGVAILLGGSCLLASYLLDEQAKEYDTEYTKETYDTYKDQSEGAAIAGFVFLGVGGGLILCSIPFYITGGIQRYKAKHASKIVLRPYFALGIINTFGFSLKL